MTKKETLDFLQGVLEKIENSSDEEIQRLREIYDKECGETQMKR